MTKNKLPVDSEGLALETTVHDEFAKTFNSATDHVVDKILPLVKLAISTTQTTRPELGRFGLASLTIAKTSKNESNHPKNSLLDVEQQLRASISIAAGLGFAQIMNGILKNPQLRDYWIRRTAKMAGKRGGRPKKRTPHIEWLEGRLRYQLLNGCCDCTANEHFDEIRHAIEIDGEDDDGNLRFYASWLESIGWHEGKKEPVITLNSVREALARIRNSL